MDEEEVVEILTPPVSDPPSEVQTGSSDDVVCLMFSSAGVVELLLRTCAVAFHSPWSSICSLLSRTYLLFMTRSLGKAKGSLLKRFRIFYACPGRSALN